MMSLQSVNSCIILTLLVSSCSAQYSDEILETCQNVNILMVSNSSTGIQILLTSAANSPTSNVFLNISSHYLPPECSDSNHCKLLHFESSGFSYYIIPSIRGFVTLSHRADHHTDATFMNIAEECNPTQAFYDDRRNHLVIACLDLQIRPLGIIHYLQYRFSPNGTGRGSITRNYDLLSLSEPIYTPENMSEVIFVREQQRCAEYDNLYFIDDAYIVHYPFNSFDPEFINSNNPLQNCPGYDSIEYYGNDRLVIRCLNNQTVVYDSCTSQFTYPSPDNVPYPCTNWDNVIYYSESKLTLHNRNGIQDSLRFPFGDLTYGKCVQTGNYSTFIGSSAGGKIFIVPFNGANSRIVNILNGNCYKGNNTCRNPVFSENEQVFGVFDSATYILVVVNLTQSCNVKNVSASFLPQLISISQGQGVYNCGCPEMLPQLSYFTTAALGISTKEDSMIEQSIPLITVVVAVVICVVTVILIVLVTLVIMVIVSKQCHKSEQCSSSASESVLLCSGQGKAAVVSLTSMGLPHTKEQHYNPEDVHKNWDKQTSTPQLRYDLNQKIEC